MINTIDVSQLSPAGMAGKVLYADTDFESLYKVEGIRRGDEMWLICSYKVPGLLPVQRSFMIHAHSTVIIADAFEPEIAIKAFQESLQKARHERMSNLFL